MLKKEEQSCPIDSYFCLNPYCYKDQQRAFSTYHSHFSDPLCKRWIINNQDFKSSTVTPYSPKQFESLQLSFDQAPIATLEKLQRLKLSDWNKWLSSLQNRIKKEIVDAIEIEFESIRITTLHLIGKSNIISDLRYIISSQNPNSDDINSYYQKIKPGLEQLSNEIIFNKNQLKQKIKIIKKEIGGIYSNMMETRKPINTLFTYQEQRQFHQYLLCPKEQSFNKLQIIASAMSKQNPNFSIIDEKISLSCIICDRQRKQVISPINKKTAKKQLAQHILSHLYFQHYQQVGFAYIRKIAKTKQIDITFQSFLQESKHFENIRIIDRQSGIKIEQSYQQYTNNRIYNIEIISIQNSHMARGKHILVSTHESIDFMIAIVSYICTQRDQKVQIYSNKESLKLGIRQILHMNPKAPSGKSSKMESKIKQQ